MNLGQAVSLCLYELAKGVKAGKSKPEANADSSEVERLTASLVEVLQVSGYLKTATADSALKIRRMVRRFKFSAGDTKTLMGVLRQMLWKMNAGE